MITTKKLLQNIHIKFTVHSPVVLAADYYFLDSHPVVGEVFGNIALFQVEWSES